jgi:DNA-binding GntR family transcriptional regulator
MGDDFPASRGPDVAEALRRQIFAGALPPGSPLDEARLAEELHVAAGLVPEALAQLTDEGLVETLPDQTRQIAVVNELHAIQLLDVLEVVLVAVFERAAPRIGSSGIAAMEARARQLEDALNSGDMPGSREILLDLIRIIIDAADHDELRAVNEHVLKRSLGRLYLYRRSEFYFLWIDGWKESVALLKAEEPDAAVQRLRRMFWVLTEELRGSGSPAEA